MNARIVFVKYGVCVSVSIKLREKSEVRTENILIGWLFGRARAVRVGSFPLGEAIVVLDKDTSVPYISIGSVI